MLRPRNRRESSGCLAHRGCWHCVQVRRQWLYRESLPESLGFTDGSRQRIYRQIIANGMLFQQFASLVGTLYYICNSIVFLLTNIQGRPNRVCFHNCTDGRLSY